MEKETLTRKFSIDYFFGAKNALNVSLKMGLKSWLKYRNIHRREHRKNNHNLNR